MGDDRSGEDCPHCGAPNRFHESVGVLPGPPGQSLSLCLTCGSVSVFTGEGWNVRPLTPDEAAELVAHPGSRQVLARWFDMIRTRN